MDRARRRRLRDGKKALAWLFWSANLSVICAFWLSGAWQELTSGHLAITLYAIARLLGLLATFCALTQFVLMGRVGWLEPLFGLDRLALFHRLNGFATITLILAHSSLMVVCYAMLAGQPIIAAAFELSQQPYVLWAMAAETLFIATVFLSLYIVRKHLRFETWYGVHLFNYLAIALVPWHQLTNGSDFLSNETFRYYWVALYTFVALNVLWWRFLKPTLMSLYAGFMVEKVVAETPTATSVYIRYRHADAVRAKGGQFIMVRFLARPFLWQEHPFSLSMLPDGERIRLTIRHIGDFTNQISQLKPGTRVLVSGPHGAFTQEQQTTTKLLYIAGGIGITPLRTLIEEQVKTHSTDNAVLLYGNRSQDDTVLLSELEAFGKQLDMPIYNVLSEQKDYAGEKGYIDKEKIARLVPDVSTRDVFLCGPPPMMAIVRKTLAELGVPERQIHYERFRLHKSD